MPVISPMACYRSWVGGGGGVDGGGGWEAGGRLYPPLGPFGLIISPRSAQTCLDDLRDVSLPLVSISDPYLHVVPSMGPIVTVVTLHG